MISRMSISQCFGQWTFWQQLGVLSLLEPLHKEGIQNGLAVLKSYIDDIIGVGCAFTYACFDIIQ